MKKCVCCNFLLVLMSACLFNTQAFAQEQRFPGLKRGDVTKMIEQKKKEIEADKNMNPAEKEKLLRLLNKVGDKKISNTGNNMLPGQPANPVSKKTRLAGISKKMPTDAEVGNLVRAMIKKLAPQIDANEKAFVQTASGKCAGNSVALSNMAVAAWYTGHPEAALMTALKAAVLPHPEAALNNVAAILNLSGYEEKAIPVLLNLLSKYRDNSTVLNNLGQAFYGLGDEAKAKMYFLQCIKRSPNHPEACNTMALMYLKAGQSRQAIDYLEQSLEGAYTASARNTLEEQKPDYNFIPVEESHFARPPDLPDLNIQMPELAYDVYTAADVRHKHDIFKQKIDAVCNALENKIDAEEAKVARQLTEQEKAGISTPFLGPGTDMFGYYTSLYEKAMLEKKAEESNLQADIEAKYEPAINAIIKDDKGNYCKRLNEVRSQKQNEMSSQYKKYIEEDLKIARQYLEKSLRVLPLISVCQAGYNANYYRMLEAYIWQYHAMIQGAPFEADCDGGGKINPYDYNPNLKLNPACRYKVVIPFIIGSMKFDCSTFEFEGGELLKLGIKRDFITNQTTLAIGAGVGIETPITELGAQQSFYISFDSDQQPTDIGMKGEIKSSAGAGVTSGTGLEYTMGMNSGIDVSVTQGARSFKL